MRKIKRIVPDSLAKMFAGLYGLLGLIAGAIFAVIAVVASAAGNPEAMFGVIPILLFPVLYGLLGFIFGYVTAFLYNFIAKHTGGIEFEIE